MKIKPYSTKPKVKFFGDGPWYIGMELEVEAPDQSSLEKGLALRNTPKSIQAKHDGSLGSRGWELVTQPFSPELWLNPKVHVVKSGPQAGTVHGNAKIVNITGRTMHTIASLRTLGYTSYDNQRCGLHFHVSREAFDGCGTYQRPTKSFHWFRVIFHGELIAKMSQRTDYHYCRRNPNAVIDPTYVQSNRYEAVNLTPKTAEVRIFRGNLREDRILAAVESVIAGVEFCNGLTEEPGVENNLPNLDQRFVVFVMANRAKYKNLAKRLDEMNAAHFSGEEPVEAGC